MEPSTIFLLKISSFCLPFCHVRPYNYKLDYVIGECFVSKLVNRKWQLDASMYSTSDTNDMRQIFSGRITYACSLYSTLENYKSNWFGRYTMD